MRWALLHRCPPPWSAAWRLWVESVQEGLCESWLVEAPQCQTYGYHQPRRNVADLVIAVPAGIDEHSAEGIQLLHRHGKFFAQQVHESGHARRSSSHYNSLDVLAARGRPEKVKGLLDFQRQNVGHTAQNLLLLFVRDTRQRFAFFQPLCVLEA